jgi:hypothetical protein
MKTQKVVFEQGNRQVIQEGNIFFNRIFENGETFESQDFNTLEKAKLDLGIAPTTQESNKLIAEFMEHHNNMGNKGLQYHSDWNWLMEVVDKIEFIDNGRFDVNILKNGTQIFEYQAGGKVIVDNVAEISFENKIEHTYKAVVEFIKWYNNQTN